MKSSKKLTDSSTFWLGLGATALDVLAKVKGWPVDTALLIASVLGYAGKEAAAKVAARPAAPPPPTPPPAN